MLSIAKRLLKTFLFVIFAVFSVEFFLIWSQASPAAVALPSEMFMVLPKFWNLDYYLFDVLTTLTRTIVAFLLALIVGIAVGVFSSKLSFFRSEAEFIVDFFRSIPATALIPLFLVLFGTGNFSTVAVGVYSGSLSIAISVIIGYRSLDKDRIRVADLIGLHGLKRIYLYELFEIAPSVFVGARAAASLCLILVVVSEMFIGATSGIGHIIMDKRYSDDVPSLYAAILISGVIGYGVNQLFKRIELALGGKLLLN